MSLLTAFGRLLREVGALQRQVQRQDTRMGALFREGVVTDVDYSKGLAVVSAHGIETKPIPWTERAGDIVEWNPPAKGERVVVVSPNGDLGRSFVLAGGFTNATPQPDNRGKHKRTKIGEAVVTQSPAGLEVVVDGATFVFSKSGLTMTVDGTVFSFTAGGFAQTGGEQKHDDHDVGSTHKHTEVTPGGGKSGPPV